ncbi:unnamed protein product [Blepharisma stoltei]|uniref:Uncharacterized protein n=1 Tax=Blepharisma stoltei TaxID=1481888 RepID=A0AAU9IZ15_9CILI|nr:unnamed protein product [Blepharisma stoltei]
MEGPAWAIALQRSFNTNRILEQSSILSIATLHNGAPSIYPIRFQSFYSPTSFTIHLDTRSILCGDLQNPVCQILWYLPLTNEIFKFDCPILNFLPSHHEYRVNEWKKLKQKEKNAYCGLPPDTYKESEGSRLEYDINNFNAQNAEEVSEHFEVLIVTPINVDHTVYLDKSAIGNTRKTYESLPQPDAVSKRWVHRKHDHVWVAREMNIPAPRP